MPLEDVSVYRAVTTGWQGAMTGKDGIYTIPGLIDGTRAVSVSKEGYQTQEQKLRMASETRFDIELVRR